MSRVKTMMLSNVSCAEDGTFKFCRPEERRVWVSSSVVVMREVSAYLGKMHK